MTVFEAHEPLPETVGRYDEDPRDGDQFTAPAGQTLGPKHPPLRLPEDDLVDGVPFPFDDPEVVKHFETRVIRSQIPGYDLMRLRCLQIGHQFVRPGTAVLDLGTSRGKMIRDLVTVAHEHERYDLIDDVIYVGVDTKTEMLASAREDMNDLFVNTLNQTTSEGEHVVRLLPWDLRNGIPGVNGYGSGYSLVTSILTLQFVPVEFRQSIVREIYESLAPGGAFVLVEKMLGSSYVTDRLLVSAYHDSKRRNGASENAIERKTKAISGSLVPLRRDENVHLLRQAGFSEFRIESFWRDLQFEALVAIKE